MNRAIRSLASLGIVAAMVIALDKWCLEPLKCSIMERRLEQSTLRIARNSDSMRASEQARTNAHTAIDCLESDPSDVNMYMIAAANFRMMHEPERAIALYQRALTYDRRRELYSNLGNAYSEAGNRNAAIENLTRANLFWGDSINDIEDPIVHDEVERRYYQYEAALKANSR